MSVKLGVVMDPIEKVNYKKDSTMAMLWAAADRGWEISYMTPQDLFLDQGEALASMAPLSVFRDPDWSAHERRPAVPSQGQDLRVG